MHDFKSIAELIQTLKKNNVSRFRLQDLEVEFHVEQGGAYGRIAATPNESNGTEDPIPQVVESFKKQEEALPADLRADVLLDHEKILNWSSPDQDPKAPELPGTGEVEL